MKVKKTRVTYIYLERFNLNIKKNKVNALRKKNDWKDVFTVNVYQTLKTQFTLNLQIKFSENQKELNRVNFVSNLMSVALLNDNKLNTYFETT